MSNDYKACPFLCELRDFEIGIENQVIGYLCKAHNNTVNELTAEIERLKGELDARNLVSKIAYADIRKLGDENEQLKKEIARIKMLLVFRRNVLLNAKHFDWIEHTCEYNALNVIIESINAPDNNVGTMGSEVKDE